MFYLGLGCPCWEFRVSGWEEAVTDRTHRSGSVQTCRRWGSPASQQALGLHPQGLLPCFGHCYAKVRGNRVHEDDKERERETEGRGNRCKCAPKQPLPLNSLTAWKSNPCLASSRISVDNVALGTLLGYLRSAEPDLWKGGRGKASTRLCQAMHCHGLFLKPQKTPHPFYSSRFPHQPCVRCSWAMDLGKPCHLHLMGKQQQSPWEQGSPSPAPPSG